MDQQLFDILTELNRAVSKLEEKLDGYEKSNDKQSEDISMAFRDNEHLIRENALAISKLIENQKNIEFDLKRLELKLEAIDKDFQGYEKRLKLLEEFRSKIIGAVFAAGMLGGSMQEIIEFVKVLF